MDFDDYVAILRRRWLWIVVPTIVAPILALLVSLRLPERYISQTLLLVEQQKVPDSVVKPIITEDFTARLASMREQVLSRARLQPILDRFQLYEHDTLSVEQKLDNMRKAIAITPIRSDAQLRTRGVPGFYITFTADNPRVAQQICGEITSLFISENLKSREQSVAGTTAFLVKQLEDAKRSLDEQDARLAEFQRKYIGQLPGQEQSSLNMLTTLNTQLEATTQALGRLEQDKTYMESMLAQEAASQSLVTKAGRTADDDSRALERLEAALFSLRSKYTDDHPDVIKAKRDLEIAKTQRDANKREGEQKIAGTAVAEDPHVQQLRAQIDGAAIAITTKRGEQQRLQSQISVYQRRLEMSPAVQEENKKLTRDYQTALEFYNDLLTKKNQSEMAKDLEQRQQGEQFRVMDPPNLPERPAFPNRPQFAAGGWVVGFVVGFIVVAFMEWRDRSVRSERDIDLWLKLPTLGTVPEFAGAGDVVGKDESRFSLRHHSPKLKTREPEVKAHV
jgi:polysaccharide chain length determinant protein (PEP-CTERM system associated)